MTISFNEEELKWIIKEAFNWHIKEDTPPDIKKEIEKKLKLLNIEQ